MIRGPVCPARPDRVVDELPGLRRFVDEQVQLGEVHRELNPVTLATQERVQARPSCLDPGTKKGEARRPALPGIACRAPLAMRRAAQVGSPARTAVIGAAAASMESTAPAWGSV